MESSLHSLIYFVCLFILQLATVVDQDRTTAEAVIQLNLSKEVMNVHFDDICEYLAVSGDDDYLD